MAAELHSQAARDFHDQNNNIGETQALRNLGQDYQGMDEVEKALSA